MRGFSSAARGLGQKASLPRQVHPPVPTRPRCAAEEGATRRPGGDLPRDAVRARPRTTQRERSLFEEKVKESRRPLAEISHLAVVRRSSETIADLLASPAARRGLGATLGGFIERNCAACFTTDR